VGAGSLVGTCAGRAVAVAAGACVAGAVLDGSATGAVACGRVWVGAGGTASELVDAGRALLHAENANSATAASNNV